MGKPLSMDLRERVIDAVEGGMSPRQAAARFSVGIATAGSWAQLKRAKGSVAPARQGKPKGSVLDPHADFIRDLIDTTPDITLEEIAERLAQKRSVKVVYTAVWKFLDLHCRKANLFINPLLSDCMSQSVRYVPKTMFFEQLRRGGPSLSRYPADDRLEYLLKCPSAGRIIEKIPFFGRQERINVRQKSAALQLFEHALFGLPSRNGLFLDVFAEHIDGPLHIELWKGIKRMRKVDQIAPFVALEQRSKLR